MIVAIARFFATGFIVNPVGLYMVTADVDEWSKHLKNVLDVAFVLV